jgi:dTDP-4-amino-4,6-dideoxygalactose transaminase
MGFQQGDFPISEEYYRRAISLPLFHSMTFAQQDEVLRILKEVIK